MSSCIFCDILDGLEEASFVHRDELVSAFMDTRPINTGHVLVVPNLHHPYLCDLPREAGERMFTVARAVASGLRRSGLECEGINLFVADGETAMQEVLHCHIHVIPRYSGDGFRLRFGAHYHFVRPARWELDAAAERVRCALPDLPWIRSSDPAR